jgi:hypothetical protein
MGLFVTTRPALWDVVLISVIVSSAENTAISFET